MQRFRKQKEERITEKLFREMGEGRSRGWTEKNDDGTKEIYFESPLALEARTHECESGEEGTPT